MVCSVPDCVLATLLRRVVRPQVPINVSALSDARIREEMKAGMVFGARSISRLNEAARGCGGRGRYGNSMG